MKKKNQQNSMREWERKINVNIKQTKTKKMLFVWTNKKLSMLFVSNGNILYLLVKGSRMVYHKHNNNNSNNYNSIKPKQRSFKQIEYCA